ncbi:MAG TPA: hypothetical protein VF523_17180 [Burkholderiales bacterium]
MGNLPAANEKRRWHVKDQFDSPWRALPGTFTTVEIWKMRVEGLFAAAIPSDDLAPGDAPRDPRLPSKR